MPTGVLEEIGKLSKKGILISGVVTWIQAQIGTHGTDIWKSLAQRCFLGPEVTAAKEALRSAKGAVFENLVTDFKVNSLGDGKETKEIEDIRKAIVALQAAGDMPLVMATSSHMQRCPQSWGVPETATVQDVMGKVMELEKAMADNIECQRQQMVDSMESQRQQMDLMKQELLSRKVEVRTPVIPQIVIPGDTPSKKRKLVETAEGQTQQQVSYAG